MRAHTGNLRSPPNSCHVGPPGSGRLTRCAKRPS